MLLLTQLSRRLVSQPQVRLSLLIIAGVFMGYTLLPLPAALERLFNTSHLFKFIVLYICGLGLLPDNLDDRHTVSLIAVCIMALAIFEFARRVSY